MTIGAVRITCQSEREITRNISAGVARKYDVRTNASPTRGPKFLSVALEYPAKTSEAMAKMPCASPSTF